MLSAKLLLLSLEAVKAGKPAEAVELLSLVALKPDMEEEIKGLLSQCCLETQAPMIGLSSVASLSQDEEGDPSDVDEEWDELIPGARVAQTALANSAEDVVIAVHSPVGIKRA